MAHITSYDDFQASLALQPGVSAATAAAPWSISRSNNSSVTPLVNDCFIFNNPNFGSLVTFSCLGAIGMGSAFDFQWNLTVNISLDMSRYGGATGLDFTWEYWPLLLSSTIPDGTSFFTDSQVGSLHFHEKGVAGNISEIAPIWNPESKVSQSGYTSVLASPGERIGYIPITLMSPVVHLDGKAALDFSLQQINFKISTLPVFTPLVSTGAIVGAVIGGIVLILLLVTATYLYRRKKRHRSDPSEKDGVGVEVEGTSSPLERDDSVPEAGVESTSPSSWVGMNAPTSVLATGHLDEPPSRVDNHVDHVNALEPESSPPKASASSHAVIQTTTADTRSSMRGEPAHASPQAALDAYTHRRTIEPPPPFSTISDEMTSITQSPPPIYGSFTSFSAWADSNRALISEDLEARLLAAGYIPSDDPDILTENEWRSHGVMKLELVRLRRIYERDRQMHA